MGTSSSADAAIRTALIGWGNSGRHYHFPHLVRDDRFEPVAVASAGGPTDLPTGIVALTGWRDAIDPSAVDLVVVATPHHLHHPIAAAALDRGLAVLVEKPLTVTVAEADDLIARADRSQTPLFVHHQRRFEEDFQVLRAIAASGEIGRPWRIGAVRGHQGPYRTSTPERPHNGAATASWAHDRASGGGVLRVIGAHPIDHVLQLAGSAPTSVAGTFSVDSSQDAERWAGVEMHFVDGLTARVDVFRRMGAPAPRFTIWGEEGMVSASSGTTVSVHRADGSQRTVEGLESPGVLGHEIYDDIAGALLRGGAPRIRATEAREVVRVIELAEASARFHDSRPLATATVGL